MKKKIRLLIIASIIGLIGLSFVQGYLINNTYKLNKDAFLEDTKRSIFRFDNNRPDFDSIYDTIGEHIVQRLVDYKLNRLPKDKFFEGLDKVQDSLNNRFIELYQNAFIDLEVSHPIKFQKRLKSIIILDSIANDTILFRPKKTETLFMLGESFSLENAYGINNSQTTTDIERSYLDNGESKIINIEFQVVMQDYFSISGWETKALNRMVSTLVISLLIFIFVIGLLYYSIESLITQKKIAEVKTDFINNITHELKTPLATLALSTKMLKRKEISSNPIQLKNTVNTIDRQTDRLQKLVDEVLNNSIGYKDIKLEKELININELLMTILDDFQIAIEQRAIVLNRDLLNEDILVNLDQFYFTTAILNILENAVKYNTEPLTISLSAKIHQDLIITITDNGVGIPKKHQMSIFEKFYRASEKEIHNVKGLGLGLYYTNQIIKAHKGSIEAESSEGKGAKFIIKLPLS